MGSEGVAYNDGPMVGIQVTVPERRDGEAWSPNLRNLVGKWGDVIKIIKKTWKYIGPIVIGSCVLEHIGSFSLSFKFSLSGF